MSVPVKIYRTVTYQEGQAPSNPNLTDDPIPNPINPDGGVSAELAPYDGAIKNVNLGEFGMSAGFMRYDTTPTGTPTDQGTTYWDVDDNTLAIIMNGAIQKVGEDSFYPVKNQTGSTIAKGTNVRFAGTVGSSGRLLIAPFLADGTFRSSFYMGVTMETIADGDDGKVMWFGRIRGINTNAFNEENVLYASTTSAGGFQTAIPQSPNNIIEVCAVINKSSTNGVIFVRPTIAPKITEVEGVKITSPTNGQGLVYNSVSGLWENKGHNDLSGKQGGDGTNFFHLGKVQYDTVNSVFTPSLQGWTQRTASSSEFWQSITYGNGIFVAVGFGTLNTLKSTDGINWENGVATAPNNWIGVAYGNGIFVAVANAVAPGATAFAMISQNGIDWTSSSIPNYSYLTISFVNDRFIAFSSGVMATSFDGINWTSTLNAIPSGSWSDIIYANGIYVAIAESGVLITSTDAVSWTSRTIPQANAWQGIAYGNGLFVAVSSNGVNRVMTSENGINWTIGTIPSYTYQDIVFANNNFVVVGNTVSVYSTDGLVWNSISVPSYSSFWRSISYGNGRFVAVSSSNNVNPQVITNDFSKTLNHSLLNLDDGFNPHGTRYEDLLGTPPSIASQIDSATEKTTVDDNDLFALVDSVASNVLKKLKWSSIKTVLQSFLDTLYAPITRSSIEQVDYVDAWYTHPITSTGSKQLNDGQQFYVPINHMMYAKANMEMTAIAFRTSAAPGATSLIRVAIYERTTANNLSLVADFGNTSMDVIGTITFTFGTPATLTKGKLYYVVFKKDNTGTSGATFQGVTTSPEHTQFLFAPSPTNMFQTNHALYKTSISTGAFPSTDTLPTESSDQIIPRFQFRLETI